MTPARVMQLLSEEEGKLIDRIFLANPSQKIVAFTSPDRHSGCSWMVSNVARRLAAKVQASVCAVDANMQFPSLHRLFGIAKEPGLAQGCSQPSPLRPFAQRIRESNLWVIPSGDSADGCLVQPSAEDVGQKLEELSESFDYILIDTAATSLSTSANSLAYLAKGVVLVIAANFTKREDALSAKIMLESAAIPILGAALNRRTYPIPDRIYKYL
jgi:Mrp family chromosome partitioning ATPase